MSVLLGRRRKRLARFFAPRADGSHIVPEELLKVWNDPDQKKREGLVDEFLASNLNKERCSKCSVRSMCTCFACWLGTSAFGMLTS